MYDALGYLVQVGDRHGNIHRSRAVQISMNVSALEEWIGNMELPRGIGSHFAPVKDLLNWLQVSNRVSIERVDIDVPLPVSIIDHRIREPDRNDTNNEAYQPSTGEMPPDTLRIGSHS